jgi:hypothetical protein
LASGLVLGVDCSKDCQVSSQLIAAGTSARRRQGSGHASLVLARGSASLKHAGHARLRLRAVRAALARLSRSHKRLPATLVISMRDAGGVEKLVKRGVVLRG